MMFSITLNILKRMSYFQVYVMRYEIISYIIGLLEIYKFNSQVCALCSCILEKFRAINLISYIKVKRVV